MAGKRKKPTKPTKPTNGHDLTTTVLIEIRDELRTLRSQVDTKFEGLRADINGLRTELKMLVARDAIAMGARVTQLEKDVEELKRRPPPPASPPSDPTTPPST